MRPILLLLALAGCTQEAGVAKHQPDLKCHNSRNGYDYEVRTSKIISNRSGFLGGSGAIKFIDQWGIKQTISAKEWNAYVKCYAIPKVGKEGV